MQPREYCCRTGKWLLGSMVDCLSKTVAVKSIDRWRLEKLTMLIWWVE